jgi:hypothetical protein
MPSILIDTGSNGRAILLMAVALSSVFSAALFAQPVFAHIDDLTVTPISVNAQSGATQTITITVSTTYSGCWGPCEATYFGAFDREHAPFVSGGPVPTGCSVANGNQIWWSGTCTATFYVFVNNGGTTPRGTYHLTFYVYTLARSIRENTITLTVI